MSASWKVGLSGNWSTAANWLGGVPLDTTDATIAAIGNYTVSIGNEVVEANSLTLGWAGATLQESATSGLVIENGLTIDAGTAIFAGSNQINSGGITVTGPSSTLVVSGTLNTDDKPIIVEFGAVLQLANPAGLGQDPIELLGGGSGTGGELLATASGTYAGPLTIATFDTNVIIAAAAGKTLTLNNGNWSIDQSVSPIQFGTAGDTGTVVWHTATPGTTDFCDLTVVGGTLKGGDANFGVLFQKALDTDVEAGAKLDLGGANIGILNLAGSGTITSSAGSPTLTLTTDFASPLVNENVEFVAAEFSGSLSLDLQALNNDFTYFIITANNANSGAATVESRVDLVIGDFDLASLGPSGNGASGSLGHMTVNLDGGELDFHRAGSVAITNNVQGTGGVAYFDAIYSVNHANSYSGGTDIERNAIYETSAAASIGSGTLLFSDGAFVATATQTLVNNVLLFDSAAFAAASGKTLTLDTANNWEFGAGTNLIIGDAAHNGTVVWNAGGSTFDDATATLEIRGGTLKDGDGALSNSVLFHFDSVTIDAGATIQLNGTFAEFNHLQGSGTILAQSGAPTTLLIGGGDFGGVFSGPTRLQLSGGVVLTGDNPDVKLVEFNPFSSLALGDGGATGSIGNATMLFDSGALIIDHSNAFALSNKLESNGTLTQYGSGTTTATNLSAFTGTLQVVAGELDVNNTASHAKALDLEGGTLATTANLSFTGTLSATGNITLAAANQTTDTLKFSSWAFDASSITFGDSGDAGAIVWHTPTSGTGIDPNDVYTVDIHAGVLKADDSNLSELLSDATQTTIDAGATLNVGTFGTAITNLQGSGAILSSTGSVLQVEGGDFAGQIKGTVTELRVGGDFTVAGNNPFNGSYELMSDSTLTFDHAAKQDVTFFGDATLVFTLGHSYTGTVHSFDLNVGQTMDFAGIDFANASKNFTNGLLNISDGPHSESIALAGNFSDQSFALSDDHHGGVAVNYTGAFAPADLVI